MLDVLHERRVERLALWVAVPRTQVSHERLPVRQRFHGHLQQTHTAHYNSRSGRVRSGRVAVPRTQVSHERLPVRQRFHGHLQQTHTAHYNTRSGQVRSGRSPPHTGESRTSPGTAALSRPPATNAHCTL